MEAHTGVPWDGSLESLFSVLDDVCRRGMLPGRLYRPAGAASPGRMGAGPEPPDLFADPGRQRTADQEEGRNRPAFPDPERSPGVFPEPRPGFSAALLHELSADAYDDFVHAWMSEFPIATEIIRFAWKVISTARKEALGVKKPAWASLPEARLGAEKAASDRGDPDVRTVLEAAYKVRREIDRLMGLLRFSPGKTGSGGPGYVARCCPDHHVLPGLAEYFTRRFGECPWAVIDEKRYLALIRTPGSEARLFPLSPDIPPESGNPADCGNHPDCFEELWRNYHHSINNSDRNNPALQRSFMPRRYWDYLPEVTPPPFSNVTNQSPDFL
jgi:hypothetical protein